MKKILFAVAELIRFIPLWVIIILCLYFTNNTYTQYKSLPNGKTEVCGTLLEKGKLFGDEYEVSILDNITKKPVVISVDKLVVDAPTICGYVDNASSRSNLGVGVAFLAIISIIVVGIGCGVLADILVGKNYYE